MFDPSSGAQIHDLNPGIEPDGLFWTCAIPDDGVKVDLAGKTASMQATNVSIDDYHDFVNAVAGGGPKPIEGKVSFKVVWTGVGAPVPIDNDDPPSSGGGFAGTFFQKPSCTAQMEWTARVGNSVFI